MFWWSSIVLATVGASNLFAYSAAKSTSRETADPDDKRTAEAMIRGLRLAHSPVAPGSSTDQPWISGPRQKKYQFHVGQQSWLVGRETCLSLNADLLTIANVEELDWVLAHYKPQLRQFRERQLQIGLLATAEESTDRQWQWVNDQPLNSTQSGVEWTAGEPFDHAEGRERCALLNVNTRTLEDVDCDLAGTPANFFRFVCERTHEKHLKHEELNNPLWKKLEDILVFFGISRPSNASDDSENELIATTPEDYDETTNNTTAVAHDQVAGSGEEPNEKVERPRKTLNDGPPPPSTAAAVDPTGAAHGTRISDSTVDDGDLLSDEKLEKTTNSTSASDSTPDPLTRTTASDPLADLADTIETAARSDGRKSPSDRMHNLERIINAVQTMLEDETTGQSLTTEQNAVGSTTQTPIEVSEGVEVVQLVDRRIHDVTGNNLVDAGTTNEQVVTALNVEGDFERAQVESRAHPNTNSGDFLLAGKHEEGSELIGCGAKNLGGTRPPTTSTVPPVVNRTAQVDQLVSSLKSLLDNSSSQLLGDLVASGNDTRSLIEKLQSATVNTTTRMPEEVRKAWVEDEIAKSLEELGEVESREFVDAVPSSNDELVAIGSGLEPPADRLVTLTPGPFKEETHNSTANGFDVKISLPTNPTATSASRPPAKDENASKSSEEVGGSGDEGDEEDTETMTSHSVFPRPDFSILKNEKQAAAAKKRLAADRQRADRAFTELNRVDGRSLADRIRESEKRRQQAASLSKSDAQTAAVLEKAFNDWIGWVDSR